MSPRTLLILGSLFAALGVAAGAFGAHALKAVLSPEQLAIHETAVRYQSMHAIALIATAWVSDRWPGRLATTAGWLFVGGILLFSGSLYLIALFGWRSIGILTPIGGLAFMAGWLCLAGCAWRQRSAAEKPF